MENDQIVDVTWLNRLATAEGDVLPTGRTLSAILLEIGYEAINGRRLRIKKTGTKHYRWVKMGSNRAESAKEVVREFHDSDDNIPF